MDNSWVSSFWTTVYVNIRVVACRLERAVMIGCLARCVIIIAIVLIIINDIYIAQIHMMPQMLWVHRPWRLHNGG